MRTEKVAFIVLILLSSVVYISSTIPVTRWNDPAGYMYAGLRIAEVGQPTYYDENNVLVGPYFTLHAFKVRPDPNSPDFYPNYSVGLPILIALAHTLLPIPKVELYLAPVMGIIGLVALFALGQKLFGGWVGLLAAALQAFNYVYWSQATENFSDVPATAFLLVGMLFSIRAIERNLLFFGLLGGATLGYACLIRYPSVLAIVPLGLYLLIATRGQKNKPHRGIAGLLTSFAFFSLAILTYNAAIFGGPFTTGYNPKHGWVPWPAFSWGYFLGRSPIQSGGYRAVLSTLWENFHLGLLLAPLGLLVMPRSKALVPIGPWSTLPALRLPDDVFDHSARYHSPPWSDVA
jgi:4-amino-4-deoxy-L-arabinose transferase-like glycosyltransferase